MKRNHTQRGFTLMELMVVIVIVAILAAVAVPLYINYVKDAQRTEAKGAIGAVVTAEQAHYQKTGGTTTPTYDSIDDLIANKELDLTESQVNWTFTTDSYDASGFKVTATNKKDATIVVSYDYKRDGTGAGWTP